MQEFFLHYLWQMQYFNKANLTTTEGEVLEIFHQGTLHGNAGPDFSNARLSIGGIQWFGQVEIHTQSSDWYVHHHERDPAYDNVVLHVVWKDDQPVVSRENSRVPTLELRGRIDQSLILKYRQLINSAFTIPCERSLRDIDEVVKTSMMSRTLVERLQRKADGVISAHQQSGNDWEETLYQLLFLNFGFKINSDPFAQLARQLPYKFVKKHIDKLVQIEALLFGQAGFLDAARGDEHYRHLRREYSILARKYNLEQARMQKAQWKYLRLRPANFPTLRIAQLSALLSQRQHLFSKVIECRNIQQLIDLFAISPSPYWQNHYSFSAQSTSPMGDLGLSSIQNIVINTVVPIWAAYGRTVDDHSFIDRAVHVMEYLPTEENKIVSNWRDRGMNIRHASDSQALIELFSNYCRPRKCLNCSIGASLIRPTP